MNPTYMAVVILLSIAVMAGVALAVQDSENKKRAKQLKLMGLKSAIRKASHLLEAFPPVLLSTDARGFLCKYLEVRWSKIVELEATQENIQQQQEFIALVADIPEVVGHPEGSMTVFNNRTDAIHALGVVKEFGQFIAEIHAKSEIIDDVAERFIKEAKILYSRTEVDLDLINAIETEQNHSPDVVIHQYRSCFSKLQNLNLNQTLDWQIYEIRAHLTLLAERMEKDNEAKRIAAEQEKEVGRSFKF